MPKGEGVGAVAPNDDGDGAALNPDEPPNGVGAGAALPPKGEVPKLEGWLGLLVCEKGEGLGAIPNGDAPKVEA